MKTIDIKAVKTRNQDAGRFFFTGGAMSVFNSEPSCTGNTGNTQSTHTPSRATMARFSFIAP